MTWILTMLGILSELLSLFWKRKILMWSYLVQYWLLNIATRNSVVDMATVVDLSFPTHHCMFGIHPTDGVEIIHARKPSGWLVEVGWFYPVCAWNTARSHTRGLPPTTIARESPYDLRCWVTLSPPKQANKQTNMKDYYMFFLCFQMCQVNSTKHPCLDTNVLRKHPYLDTHVLTKHPCLDTHVLFADDYFHRNAM